MSSEPEFKTKVNEITYDIQNSVQSGTNEWKLSDIKERETVTIRDLRCDLTFYRLLMSIGVAPGRIVTVLVNRKGVILVGIENSIIALDKNVASKIIVGDSYE